MPFRYYSWLYTHHFISNTALNVIGDNDNTILNKAPNNDDTHQIKEKSSSKDILYLDDDLCLDLVFNFLVSHVTREGPIKVTQRKRSGGFTSSDSGRLFGSEGSAARLGFKSRQRCFSTLINQSFGYLPLVKSQMRLDPVLFKDSVSNSRKKYRKLELV